MPELPEVETVVRDLRLHLVGKKFTKIEVSALALRRTWLPAWEAELVGRSVVAIERRGKWILLDLNGPWLLVHLGMTGQFTVADVTAERASHTHLVFGLRPGRHELRFRDVRRFGSATLYANRADLDGFFVQSRLGPEPFSVDKTYWRSCFANTNRCIKAVLLDQRVVAGVGNIYADESLFEAKLHPSRLGKDLEKVEIDKLRDAVVKVLTRAIEKRGSTIRDYVGGSGLKGGFQREFRAYGRTGQPCARCRTPIERDVMAGRSTHFCPKCQK